MAIINHVIQTRSHPIYYFTLLNILASVELVRSKKDHSFITYSILTHPAEYLRFAPTISSENKKTLSGHSEHIDTGGELQIYFGILLK